MSLKSIAQSVMTELKTVGIVVDDTVFIGSSTKSLKTTPPSFFWVPKRGTGGGPSIAMSRAQQDAWAVANPDKPVPRALHTRLIDVEIHIWGNSNPASTDDYHTTEDLINQFLSALHHQAYGSYKFNGESWVGTGADAMYYGRRVILYVTIIVPVLENQTSLGSTVVNSVDPITTEIGPLQPSGATFSS